MKILASTTALSKQIESILSLNVKTFDIDGAENVLTFRKENYKIDFPVEVVNPYRRDNYFGTFHKDTWEGIMKFLQQLPEQPIVLTFENYNPRGYNKAPSVELSQFVMTF